MPLLRSVAALYDIHGNLPALDAVVAELHADPPDAVVVGGDVAAGPQPKEVLTRLRELPWPVHWLRGNADRAVVMGFDGTIPPELAEHPLFAGDAWAATFLDRADRASSPRWRRCSRSRSRASGLSCSATARRAATRSA